MGRRKYLERRNALFAVASLSVTVGGCEGILGVDFDHVPVGGNDDGGPPPPAISAPDGGKDGAHADAEGDARLESNGLAWARRLTAGAHSTCAITPRGEVKCYVPIEVLGFP